MKLYAFSFLILNFLFSIVKARWTVDSLEVSINEKTRQLVSKSLAEFGKLEYLEFPDETFLKIKFETLLNNVHSRPHQAFIIFKDDTTGVEATYPASIRDSGRAKFTIENKDLPTAFKANDKNLSVSLVVASFGEGKGTDIYLGKIINKTYKGNKKVQKPVRYGYLPEIRHIFNSPPKSTSFIISLIFIIANVAILSFSLFGYAYLGLLNFKQLKIAFKSNPVSHIVFISSFIFIEYIFFNYYVGTSIFTTVYQTLLASIFAILSGNRVLREVASRRASTEKVSQD